PNTFDGANAPLLWATCRSRPAWRVAARTASTPRSRTPARRRRFRASPTAFEIVPRREGSTELWLGGSPRAARYLLRGFLSQAPSQRNFAWEAAFRSVAMQGKTPDMGRWFARVGICLVVAGCTSSSNAPPPVPEPCGAPGDADLAACVADGPI